MNLNDSRRIYKKLMDETSREIFKARLIYSACGDHSPIIKMKSKNRNLSSDIECFSTLVSCLPENIIIWGAGYAGRTIKEFLYNGKIKAFIDNNIYMDGKVIDDIPVYTLNSYIDRNGINENDRFVIGVMSVDAQCCIKEQLMRVGYKENQICLYVVSDWRNNSSQYFDFFSPKGKEAFVDCGCFDGSTAYRFVAWCGSNGYEHIYGFEADKVNYEKCKKNLNGLKNIDLYPYGLADYTGKAYFEGIASEASKIIKNGNDFMESINVVTLDDCIGDKNVTYIKMDIEGAEYEALLGASKIIKTQKPRLAISVYHDIEHFVSIPILLLNLNPNYKFWLRQYSLLPNETILYAE